MNINPPLYLFLHYITIRAGAPDTRTPALWPELPRMLLLGNPWPPGVTSAMDLVNCTALALKGFLKLPPTMIMLLCVPDTTSTSRGY